MLRDRGDCHVVAFTAAQIPNIAGRAYPAELAGPLYPNGIPIVEEEHLEKLIEDFEVNVVLFSYSDISHANLMHLASRAVAGGADFWLPGTEHTQLKAPVPVVSVCAVRTGCGKSPLSRMIVSQLRQRAWRPVVVRHPMPYGDLATQVVQRFASMEDLDRQQCTIEEREEYEPHIREGTVVYAGVDYEQILDRAAGEGDIIVWDGGNNDTPFYASNLEIVVADPHRAGDELAYFPGEVNLRRADVVVITKVDTASRRDVETIRRNVALSNPKAAIVEAACPVSVFAPEIVRGQRVLVVEDGPTLTHGEMSFGAGIVAARQCGAAELIDPRPYAIGSIRDTYERYPLLANLLPAMGYSTIQRRELEETINRTPCDLVLIATPIDLDRVIQLNKPSLRVTYEIKETPNLGLAEILAQFTQSHARAEVLA
jgi:predicted GTPase